MTGERLRLALDQNFPTPLLEAVHGFLPTDIELRPLSKVDRRLANLGDRELLIALQQLGYAGLVTNNYKMLRVPAEIAAIVKTKAVVVAIEARGHDPIRAVGALLLELPGLVDRLRPGVSNVFLLDYERRRPKDAWSYLAVAAARVGKTPDALWDQVKVTDRELATQVLN